MSATQSTPNYQLPIFEATDKPSWMGDFNGAMTKIDTAIKAASESGGGGGGSGDEALIVANEAKTLATQANSTAEQASSTASSASTTASAASTLAQSTQDGLTQTNKSVTKNTSDISTIQTQLPTLQQNITTAQSTATQAQTDASKAKSDAASALSTAQSASSTASNAQSTASSAASAASTAQSTANSALLNVNNLAQQFNLIRKCSVLNSPSVGGMAIQIGQECIQIQLRGQCPTTAAAIYEFSVLNYNIPTSATQVDISFPYFFNNSQRGYFTIIATPHPEQNQWDYSIYLPSELQSGSGFVELNAIMFIIPV